MTQVATSIIHQGKAYLATNALIRGNGYLMVEPVYVTSLTIQDLSDAFARVLAAGHPEISPPTKEEMKHRRDPILAATGVKSWNKLAKSSYSYSLAWHGDTVTLYLHQLDERGRFASGTGRSRVYPADTPLPTLVEAILEDVTALSGTQ